MYTPTRCPRPGSVNRPRRDISSCRRPMVVRARRFNHSIREVTLLVPTTGTLCRMAAKSRTDHSSDVSLKPSSALLPDERKRHVFHTPEYMSPPGRARGAIVDGEHRPGRDRSRRGDHFLLGPLGHVSGSRALSGGAAPDTSVYCCLCHPRSACLLRRSNGREPFDRNIIGTEPDDTEQRWARRTHHHAIH
jgi:hypothetical protein